MAGNEIFNFFILAADANRAMISDAARRPAPAAGMVPPRPLAAKAGWRRGKEQERLAAGAGKADQR